jgi:hypothetical protein
MLTQLISDSIFSERNVKGDLDRYMIVYYA